MGVGRIVPPHIARPPYARGLEADRPEAMVKDASTIARMRRTGALAAEIVAIVADSVRPGISTDDLDQLGHALAVEADAYPSPLGYGPKDNLFPKSICTSVNEEICHGIPGPRVLDDGDIISIDVTVYREGVHGDTCVSVPVGSVDDDGRRLIETTREALAAAIATVAPGAQLRQAGQAIEAVATREGFGVVRDFVGHGVGAEFHADPRVPHYDEPRFSVICVPGMTFTIEPMIAERGSEADMLDDGWTAVTVDGSRVAQFEHTLVVTENGVDVLTTPA
jgi:methionyl aminopeptidase